MSDSRENHSRGVGAEMRSLHLALAVCGVLFPFALLLWLMAQFVVNVPFMDEWDAVGRVLLAYENADLCWTDFTAMHNEIRPVIPRAVALALYRIAGRWDIRLEIGFSVLLASATLFLLWQIVRRHGIRPPRAVFLLFIASIVAFSPVAWENWLMGMQFMNYILTFLLVLGIWLQEKRLPYAALVPANILLCVISTFTFSSGMLLWFLFLPIYPLFSGHRIKRAFAVIGLTIHMIAAVVAISLYFRGYHKPEVQPGAADAIQEPLRLTEYFLTWLGSGVVPTGSAFFHELTALVGACVLVAFVAFASLILRPFRKGFLERMEECNPWLILGAFALGNGVAVSLGRSTFGVDQAGSSRYTMISLYLLLATLGLACGWFEMRAVGKRSPLVVAAASSLITLLSALILHSSFVAFRQAEGHSLRLRAGETAIRLLPACRLPQMLSLMHPDVNSIERVIENKHLLESLHMDMFTPEGLAGSLEMGHQLPPANGWFDSCSVEGTRIRFSGWAEDPSEPGQSAPLVLLTARGHGRIAVIGACSTGIPRPDVVLHRRSRGMRLSGFDGEAALPEPLGRYIIEAWAVSGSQSRIQKLEGAWSIHVRQPPDIAVEPMPQQD